MDQKLFFLINREWISPALDFIMAVLSSFDFWVPILFVLIVPLLIFGGFKLRACLISIALIIGCVASLGDSVLKKLVNRPRPHQAISVRVVDLKKAKPRFLALAKPLSIKASRPATGKINGRSFPSGHAMNNFVILAVLVCFYKWRGLLFAPFAVGVAYSRIYTGAHWPSDVLASAFLGSGLAILGLVLIEWAWRRLVPRFFPEFYLRHPSIIFLSDAPSTTSS